MKVVFLLLFILIIILINIRSKNTIKGGGSNELRSAIENLNRALNNCGKFKKNVDDTECFRFIPFIIHIKKIYKEINSSKTMTLYGKKKAIKKLRNISLKIPTFNIIEEKIKKELLKSII